MLRNDISCYDVNLERNKKLTSSFTVGEFACNDGSPALFLCPALVNKCQEIRNGLGKPVTVNSGYRTPTYNNAVGGANNSMHMYGMAADLSCKSVSIATLVQVAQKAMGERGGLGVYKTFVHIDVRKTRARW